MDIFVEQLLKRKQSAKDRLIFAGILIAALIVVYLSLVFIPSFSFLVLVGVCAGCYYLISSRNLEFEYSITNGDITIDRVINRSRRKRVVVVDAHDIEDIGKFRPELVRQKQAFKKISAAEYDDGRDAWYFCARTTKYGNVFVIFSPDERTLNAIKPFVPRQVAFVAFGRN